MELPERTVTKGFSAMLVLSRKQSQSIVINDDIRVTVVSIAATRFGSVSKHRPRWRCSARSYASRLP